MSLKVSKVDVWAAEIEDRPGGLADKLGPLGEAGASLECVIARRDPSKPGKGVVFVSPVKGARVQKAAKSAGLSATKDLATLRVEGSDAPGLGHRLTSALAAAGINLRGLSAASSGKNFVAYFGFDSADTATKAARVLKSAAAAKKKPAARKKR
jgi:hypothetical protein